MIKLIFFSPYSWRPWCLLSRFYCVCHLDSPQVESLRWGEWRRLDFAKGCRGLYGSLASKSGRLGRLRSVKGRVEQIVFKVERPDPACFLPRERTRHRRLRSCGPAALVDLSTHSSNEKKKCLKAKCLCCGPSLANSQRSNPGCAGRREHWSRSHQDVIGSLFERQNSTDLSYRYSYNPPGFA